MNSIDLAKQIRQVTAQMVYKASASHIGGALSMADILAVLYADVMHFDPKNPQDENRDRFILSKGHTCASYYATLGLMGYYPMSFLDEFAQEGSLLLEHTSHHIPGVELSTGSLGHGLPVGCGIAYGAKKLNKSFRTYVIVGDGDMEEGSNWEALLLGAQLKLDNLCLIIDYNKIQCFGTTNEIINFEPYKAKLDAFNWNCIELDGHDHDALRKAFKEAETTKGKPTVILANTIKGKGWKAMEGKLFSHYHSPNEEEYKQLMEDLSK